jgi:hypothetical protein
VRDLCTGEVVKKPREKDKESVTEISPNLFDGHKNSIDTAS